MAVTWNPPFTQASRSAVALCTAAKTTYNDATNAVLLLTAGADGSRVYGIKAIPRATVTATQLQLYLSKDGGVTLSLIDSVLMAAYTMSQTTAVPNTYFTNYDEGDPIRLGANDRLYVAIGVALGTGIQFSAYYEDF